MQVSGTLDAGERIEAASYALSHRRDAAIEAKIDAIVDDLAKAQSADGYLNCWYNGREPEKRWTNSRDNHELYNAGHLLEAPSLTTARRAGGRFLEIMERYIDHMAATFGPGPGKARRPRASGNRACARQALPPDRGPPRPLILRPTLSTSADGSRTISPRRRGRAATTRPPIGRRLTSTVNPTGRCGSRRRSSVTPCAGCTWLRLWRISRSNSATRARDRVRNPVARRDNDADVRDGRPRAGFARTEGFTKPFDLPNETAYAEPAPPSPSPSGLIGCCTSTSTVLTLT